MHNRGFSLIETLVSVAILGLMIAFIATVNEFTHRETAGDERLGEGIRAGVFISNSLRDLGFLDLVKRCQDEAVFQTSSTAMACLSGDKLTTAVAQPAPGLIPLKVKVNSAGEPDALGNYCVEMKSCRLIADGHLIAVNVTTTWIGSDAKPRFTNHQLRVLR